MTVVFFCLGEMDQHEAAAAEISRARQGHGERKADRNRRIDRIAAAPENLDADFRRLPFLRDDHAVARQHRQNARALRDDRRAERLGARAKGKEEKRKGGRDGGKRPARFHRFNLRHHGC